MRERKLIKLAGPCDTDYTDKSIQNLSDAKKKGRVLCSNLEECQKGDIFCTLNLGWRIAQFVMKDRQDLGNALESDGKYFLEKHPEGKFWVKKDGEWSIVKGKSNALDYIKKFAIIVIDEDPSNFKPVKSPIFKKPSDVIINMSDAMNNTIQELRDMAKEFKKK